ncbi:hypothetical protein [Ferrovibrio sp.]|uniref:hypothetical protein n=1 Tax=Ferrovibrio sp. TaxID=1917215 RepID=UPI0035B2254D
MALTKFQLCSRALVALDREAVSSFSDSSKEAELAAVMYEGVYKSELSNYTWNFNTTQVELSREVSTPGDVNWSYQYTMPSDWLRTLNVTAPVDGADIDYVERAGKVYSNETRALMLYQAEIVEANLPPYFQDSFIARLKGEFAEALVGEGAVIERAWAEYDRKLKIAKRIDAQSNPPVQFITAANSTWVRARQGW